MRWDRCGWQQSFAALLLGVVLAWPTPASAASSTGWRWPLVGVPTVLRPFQPPPTPYAAGHRGVDLAAPVGAAVLAAGAGVIGYAGVIAGRGVVTVVHGALRTTYEPVTAVVRVGQPVTAGEPIGRLGPPTGHCGAGRSCLHWGLLRGDMYLNPLALLGLAHSILLPVWGMHPNSAGAAAAGDLPGHALPVGRAPPSASPRRESGEPLPPWLPAAATGVLLAGAGVLSTQRR